MTTIDDQIAALEAEVSAKMEQLTALKRQYGSDVEDHVLLGADGSEHRLSELFGVGSDLIVVHNMGKRCSYCTLWADGFNGIYRHLADRAAFVVVSPDAPDVQRAFAESRGWRFPMYSDSSKEFTRAMGFITRHNDADYWLPGYSTFSKNADGTIRRVAKDFFGPGDLYCSLWHMFGLLAGGPGEWQPSITYDVAAA